MRVRFFTSILALLAETVSAAPVVSLKEINPPAADTNRILAIVGATLIDGKGGAPVSNAVVVVRGAKISTVPKAERGWAYQRELELLAECGLIPMEIIAAATRNNAEFFRVSARLRTIEPGKLADLVLIDGDPLQDIRAMRRVERVMTNGRWITPPTSDKFK